LGTVQSYSATKHEWFNVQDKNVSDLELIVFSQDKPSRFAMVLMVLVDFDFLLENHSQHCIELSAIMFSESKCPTVGEFQASILRMFLNSPKVLPPLTAMVVLSMNVPVLRGFGWL
jgi:hypothetical protein